MWPVDRWSWLILRICVLFFIKLVFGQLTETIWHTSCQAQSDWLNRVYLCDNSLPTGYMNCWSCLVAFHVCKTGKYMQTRACVCLSVGERTRQTLFKLIHLRSSAHCWAKWQRWTELKEHSLTSFNFNATLFIFFHSTPQCYSVFIYVLRFFFNSFAISLLKNEWVIARTGYCVYDFYFWCEYRLRISIF